MSIVQQSISDLLSAACISTSIQGAEGLFCLRYDRGTAGIYLLLLPTRVNHHPDRCPLCIVRIAVLISSPRRRGGARKEGGARWGVASADASSSSSQSFGRLQSYRRRRRRNLPAAKAETGVVPEKSALEEEVSLPDPATTPSLGCVIIMSERGTIYLSYFCFGV